ncbi:MAG TPA: 2-succinyl-5-enolpyruvyl-6-hydroxy-3-cyclohexene-1-carboxylic-acid synthase [Thermoanaerobaculia bacterium]|nr:2-succinyl-5-enolpyruvyl-6-hydroxy-3-cyclohexene-1-carboxylic-acid synthase [Thermoanaerobaculia bacterium]
MTNLELAVNVLELARRFGVREFCVGAGFRNSPFLKVLAENAHVTTLSFFDERSAGFFAYGRSKRDERPVAVITTSGTASAELLPAAIEAHYSSVPLLLITADRPQRFRGTGAPQSIEQPGLFGAYVETSVDLSTDVSFPLRLRWREKRPLHINVCFDEPLLDGEVPRLAVTDDQTEVSSRASSEGSGRGPYDGTTSANDDSEREAPTQIPRSTLGMTPSVQSVTIENFLQASRRPLLLLGSLNRIHRAAARDLALRLGAPVHAEPLSGLREDSLLDHLLLRSGERILQRGNFDSVLRIGGVPALRFWRDLEQAPDVAVLSLSPAPFSGLSRGRHMQGVVSSIINEVAIEAAIESRIVDEKLFSEDRRMSTAIAATIDREPHSELSLLRSLSATIPPHSMVFLGNSLPIREWDFIASRDERSLTFDANRGANGIDGELSTFFGRSEAGRSNWAILGDLTTLYDLSAPWIVSQLETSTELRIVVINNGGGKIFSRVPGLAGVDPVARRRLFETVHSINFRGWAEMWDLHYESWTAVGDPRTLPARAVIEILPDADATRRLWDDLDALWSRG